MRKPMSRRMHGLTDWSYIPFVAVSPDLLDFRSVPSAVTAAGICSGVILISTLFTRAEWGFFRTMPYRYHLIIDAANGAFALAAPWLLGFAGVALARNTFVVVGLIGIANGLLLSRLEEMPSSAHPQPQV